MTMKTPSIEMLEKLNQLNGYKNERKTQYPGVQEQLDMLWHDIDAGKFGEEAWTGRWYMLIKNIKETATKPDVAALTAELEEIIKKEQEK